MILRLNAFVLLLVMFGYLLKPILPYVEYALNKSYIEKNLCINRDKPKNCCHGKCYLKKQLVKQSEDSKKEKNAEKKKKNSNNEVKEFITDNTKLLFIPNYSCMYTDEKSNLYSLHIVVCIFVPPKLIA